MRNWKWLQSKWSGLLIVAAIFIFMAALSWRRWAEVVVDFGQQLYVPWRLSQGDVLYRDVKHLPGGPFSQYFNALLFKIFGVSFRTLIFANLTITAGMLVLIYRRFLMATDRWMATTICVAIVIVFAFAHYTNGNYNYVAPYAHEAFHGLVLSVLGIVFLAGWIEKKNFCSAFGAGFSFGAVFLTKPDIFLALSATTFAALVLIRIESAGLKFILKSVGFFFLGAILLPLFFFFFFLRVENVAVALHSVAYAWVPVLETSVARGAYYKWCMGLDIPFEHLRKLAFQLVCLLGAIFLYAILFRKKVESSRDKIILLAASAILLAGVSMADWTAAGYPLPLLALTLLVFLWIYYRHPMVRPPPIFPALWTVFALILPMKMGLFCRVWHYGFVLAMPAFVSAIYLLIWLLPQWLEKFGVHRGRFRWLMQMVLVFACAQYFAQSEIYYVKENLSIGADGDQIKTFNDESYPEGAGVSAAISWLQTNAPPQATLAVLPEGALVNYLTRRVNPSGYSVWMPPEMSAFGQTNMVAAFEQHRPDYVMLIHNRIALKAYSDMGNFGSRPQYGLALMQWIHKNYDVVYQYGDVPLQTQHFGLQILKRHSMSPSTP